VLQVEEQELAICSGRRSISKNTTFKKIKDCRARRKKEDKEKRFCIGGAATIKEREERRERVRRCAKHIV